MFDVVSGQRIVDERTLDTGYTPFYTSIGQNLGIELACSVTATPRFTRRSSLSDRGIRGAQKPVSSKRNSPTKHIQ